MLGKRDRDGRIMSTMKEVSFQYSRLVTPFSEKRIEREKESKVTKMVWEGREKNKRVSGPASNIFFG
jgi:hypothetical protein